MSVEVHHEVTGPADGPAVVLAGSLGSDLRMWEPQVEPLVAAGFRVVRYDQRGHGRSPAPPGPYSIAELGEDLVALLDRLELPRVSLAGLSLGGMTGMWLARHHPARLDRLVLCCTSAELGPREMWAERANTVRESGLDSLADAGVGRWLTHAGRAANPALSAWLREMFTSQDPEGYASCCTAIETMSLVDSLPSVLAPTLVIAGAEDQATPPDHARRIAGAIPGARLEIVEGAAHLGNVERPAEFTALILNHLRTRHAAGTKVRRAVLGDEHVNRADAATTDFTRPFQHYITESAWGSVWARPGLDRRTRSVITLTALTALKCHDELPMHVRAAIGNGLTPAEISEILLHTSVYAGVPAANSAFAIAQRTLDELATDDTGSPLVLDVES
jgi:3-oxoadipate enol-lactonase/4-carboxymuconolactone decarboxylase